MKAARGPLGAFFRRFNLYFGKTTDAYVGGVKMLIRRSVLAMLVDGTPPGRIVEPALRLGVTTGVAFQVGRSESRRPVRP